MGSCQATSVKMTELECGITFDTTNVVSRYRDPQLQVGENYLYLLKGL